MEEADLLDDWLKLDVLNYLRIREKQVPVFKQDSPQFQRRRYIVDWMCLVCANVHLSTGSVHLSVKLMDNFMDHHDIAEHQLNFVAMGCILLAAKFEDSDDKIPRLSTIRPYLSGHYDRDSFVNLELMIFSHFGFNLSIPTASHFCDLLVPLAVNQTDCLSGLPIPDISLVKQKFADYIRYFLDISLQNQNLVGELSSAVACSVIFCTREVLCLSPKWPQTLQTLTGYLNSEQFWAISCQLLSVFQDQTSAEIEIVVLSSQEPTPPRKKFRLVASSPDEGYISSLNVSPVEPQQHSQQQQHFLLPTHPNQEQYEHEQGQQETEEIVVLYESGTDSWVLKNDEQAET